MYTHNNFKTKKALREAVAAKRLVHVYQPGGIFVGTADDSNAIVTIEGPHFPEPHRWYARVQLREGCVVKVLS